jgi:hypothetical protein
VRAGHTVAVAGHPVAVAAGHPVAVAGHTVAVAAGHPVTVAGHTVAVAAGHTLVVAGHTLAVAGHFMGDPAMSLAYGQRWRACKYSVTKISRLLPTNVVYVHGRS